MAKSVTHCPTWLNTTPSGRAVARSLTTRILTRVSVARHALGPEVAVVARQAASGREVELPVVEAARQHPVGDLAEPREVGLAVRAPAFDAPAVPFEEFVGALASASMAPLHVRDPLR